MSRPTQLIVSGRPSHVSNAIAQIEKILDDSSLTNLPKSRINKCRSTPKDSSSMDMSTLINGVDKIGNNNNTVPPMIISSIPTSNNISEAVNDGDSDVSVRVDRRVTVMKVIKKQSQDMNGMDIDKIQHDDVESTGVRYGKCPGAKKKGGG